MLHNIKILVLQTADCCIVLLFSFFSFLSEINLYASGGDVDVILFQGAGNLDSPPASGYNVSGRNCFQQNLIFS